MKLAFDKLDIIGRAEAEEKAFTGWVEANRKRQEKYGTVLHDIAEAVKAADCDENYEFIIGEKILRYDWKKNRVDWSK